MSVRLRKYKNGTERYIIDHYPDGAYGKRRWHTMPVGMTEAEAKEIERLMRLSRQKTISINAQATINEISPQYLTWYKMHRAESTFENISGVFKNHISRLLGKHRASEINHHNINVYKQIRMKEKKMTYGNTVSNRTISKELAYLSGLLSWCTRHIEGFPSKQFRIEKLPYKSPLPDVLTYKEAMSIIEKAELKYRPIFRLMMVLGLRSKEARTLLWSNVDMKNKAINVKQKGGSFKVLPLNKDIISELSAIERVSDYVFPSRNRTKAPVRDLRIPLAHACQKAGITKKVYPHLFRHSCGTHLIASGVDIRTVQEILGHTTISTTQLYTHLNLDMKRKALQQSRMA